MSFCPMKEVGPRTAAIRRSCFVATNVEIRSVTFCSFLQLCAETFWKNLHNISSSYKKLR